MLKTLAVRAIYEELNEIIERLQRGEKKIYFLMLR